MDNEYKKLILNAKFNDKKALDEVLKKEKHNIYTTLLYLKVKTEDIDDIAQNILFKLSSKIKQLKDANNFKTWLNQIIINTYYDYLRKQKNKSNLNLEAISDDAIVEIPDYTTNPQDYILKNELDFVIKTSIENLPIHYKIPITLREIQGLSYDEISNITKLSVGTVKSRIARARERIKNDIEKYANQWKYKRILW